MKWSVVLCCYWAVIVLYRNLQLSMLSHTVSHHTSSTDWGHCSYLSTLTNHVAAHKGGKSVCRVWRPDITETPSTHCVVYFLIIADSRKTRSLPGNPAAGKSDKERPRLSLFPGVDEGRREIRKRRLCVQECLQCVSDANHNTATCLRMCIIMLRVPFLSWFRVFSSILFLKCRSQFCIACIVPNELNEQRQIGCVLFPPCVQHETCFCNGDQWKFDSFGHANSWRTRTLRLSWNGNGALKR